MTDQTGTNIYGLPERAKADITDLADAWMPYEDMSGDPVDTFRISIDDLISGVVAGSQALTVVDTIADLRALTNTSDTVIVRGHTAAGDGGGGLFLLLAGSGATPGDIDSSGEDDDGWHIVNSSGAIWGREASVVIPQMFGAVSVATTTDARSADDQAAIIQRAIDFWSLPQAADFPGVAYRTKPLTHLKFELPTGLYRCESTIEINLYPIDRGATSEGIEYQNYYVPGDCVMTGLIWTPYASSITAIKLDAAQRLFRPSLKLQAYKDRHVSTGRMAWDYNTYPGLFFDDTAVRTWANSTKFYKDEDIKYVDGSDVTWIIRCTATGTTDSATPTSLTGASFISGGTFYCRGSSRLANGKDMNDMLADTADIGIHINQLWGSDNVMLNAANYEVGVMFCPKMKGAAGVSWNDVRIPRVNGAKFGVVIGSFSANRQVELDGRLLLEDFPVGGMVWESVYPLTEDGLNSAPARLWPSTSTAVVVNDLIKYYIPHPTGTYTSYTCTQSTGVNTTTDVLTFSATVPATGTPVQVSSSTTLPAPLAANTTYWIRSASGSTCKLATTNADANIIDITSTGSGTLTMSTTHCWIWRVTDLGDGLLATPYPTSANCTSTPWVHHSAGPTLVCIGSKWGTRYTYDGGGESTSGNWTEVTDAVWDQTIIGGYCTDNRITPQHLVPYWQGSTTISSTQSLYGLVITGFGYPYSNNNNTIEMLDHEPSHFGTTHTLKESVEVLLYTGSGNRIHCRQESTEISTGVVAQRRRPGYGAVGNIVSSARGGRRAISASSHRPRGGGQNNILIEPPYEMPIAAQYTVDYSRSLMFSSYDKIYSTDAAFVQMGSGSTVTYLNYITASLTSSTTGVKYFPQDDSWQFAYDNNPMVLVDLTNDTMNMASITIEPHFGNEAYASTNYYRWVAYTLEEDGVTKIDPGLITVAGQAGAYGNSPLLNAYSFMTSYLRPIQNATYKVLWWGSPMTLPCVTTLGAHHLVKKVLVGIYGTHIRGFTIKVLGSMPARIYSPYYGNVAGYSSNHLPQLAAVPEKGRITAPAAFIFKNGYGAPQYAHLDKDAGQVYWCTSGDTDDLTPSTNHMWGHNGAAQGSATISEWNGSTWASIATNAYYTVPGTFDITPSPCQFNYATDADTTPSVYGMSTLAFANTGATSVTGFDDAVLGQRITLYLDGNTTLKHAGAVGDEFGFILVNGADFTGAIGTTLEFICDGAAFREINTTRIEAHATIYCIDAVTAQTPSQNTWTKCTGFTTDGLEVNANADAANDRIAITVGGKYEVRFQVSFSADASSTVQWRIYSGSTPAASYIKCSRMLGTGGDVGSASCCGTLSLAAGDYVEVWVYSDDGTPSITPKDMQLSVHKIN